jgi:hypothetical protein
MKEKNAAPAGLTMPESGSRLKAESKRVWN